jgi:hypothetical protein
MNRRRMGLLSGVVTPPVRGMTLAKPLSLGSLAGVSALAGGANRSAAEIAALMFRCREEATRFDTETVFSHTDTENTPDTPDTPDRGSNSKGLPCQGRVTETAAPLTGAPVPPGDACRHCGRPVDWRRDGVAFADGSGAHLACYEAVP